MEVILYGYFMVTVTVSNCLNFGGSLRFSQKFSVSAVPKIYDVLAKLAKKYLGRNPGL